MDITIKFRNNLPYNWHPENWSAVFRIEILSSLNLYLMRRYLLGLVLAVFALQAVAQKPVVTSHPRLFLNAEMKAFLMNKKTTNNADWIALKNEADDYASRGVLAWNPTNCGVWDTDYIFYNYCGSSWDEAVFCLGMAHQLTKGSASGQLDDKYSDKLLQLADSIITGYAAYPPCSGCSNMFLWNSTYATRHVGNVVGIIYDWCYDELGATRKAALLHIMEDFFDYMRVPYNVYQHDNHPTGNYYFGHVLCAAYFGYASYYDSPKAQMMIDYSRQRVLGTESGTLGSSDKTKNWLMQAVTGPLPTSVSEAYLGPKTYTGAPMKDGIHVQGWSYGGETLKRVIDWSYIVNSATGEKVADSLYSYFSKMSEAWVHQLAPNRFQCDNSNDWGSFIGNLISYAQPLELGAVLEGTPQGPIAEYVYRSWITKPNLTPDTWNKGYPELNWEKMMFKNTSRPASAFDYTPYYPVPTKATYNSVDINGTLPRYYMRENWSDTASWCALTMSNAFYDDHDHHNAGHFQILRGDSHDGDDQLLVGGNEIGQGGSFGLNGIGGGTSYWISNSSSNTLFIDDYMDYSENNVSHYNFGGQSFWGYEEPTHVEQNADRSYVRADLASAYHRKGEVADTVNRAVKQFQRSFLYLRNSDLFLCYDKIGVKNSTHPNGQYKKHLRWHFMENPSVSGNNLTAMMDNSKIYMHTVIPSVVNIAKVDESNNPDNTWGPSLNYAFNSPTWRAEVTLPGNPLNQTILTVFQPGSKTAAEMTTTGLNTIEGLMEGTVIALNNKSDIVLFNKSNAKYLVPVTNTSYSFSGDTTTLHTLCGMVPAGKYQVDYANNTVTIAQSAQGNVTATDAGVLSFRVPFAQPNGIEDLIPTSAIGILKAYPIPTNGPVTFEWNLEAGDEARYLEITDINGKVVLQQPLQPKQTKVEVVLEGPAGSYSAMMWGWSSIKNAAKAVGGAVVKGK